jgi:hypothetical protein
MALSFMTKHKELESSCDLHIVDCLLRRKTIFWFFGLSFVVIVVVMEQGLYSTDKTGVGGRAGLACHNGMLRELRRYRH